MVLNYLFRKRPEYRTTKLLCFSKEQMYEVVADIENYCSFLPFCTKSIIVEKNQSDLKVNLEIGFPPLKEKYTSVVVMNKPNLISAKSCDGELFDYLETVWKFSSVPQGDPMTCIVDFSIKFKFKSFLYTHVATIFFGKLVKSLEAAFVNEAVRRYGRSSTCIFEMTSQD